MHAALIVLASLFTDVTPPPTDVALAGCTTPSAIRTAEIRLTAADDARMPGLLDELLHQADGATCLLESEVLLNLHHNAHVRDQVATAFIAGLNAPAADVKGRAQLLVSKVRVADPVGYDEIMRRAEDARGLWRNLDKAPLPLPRSLAERMGPVQPLASR